jgi:hypothetical protein
MAVTNDQQTERSDSTSAAADCAAAAGSGTSVPDPTWLLKNDAARLSDMTVHGGAAREWRIT